MTQKITICAPSHNFVGPYLRNYGMYRQSEKAVKQQYLIHMFPQYGELRHTSGWDRFGSLRHRSKFQRVSRLGSVTARHSSSERQPNIAALNRGRRLYSAGRPSRWALAHILVLSCFFLSLWPPYVIGQAITLLPCGLFLSSFSSQSQRPQIGCLPYT